MKRSVKLLTIAAVAALSIAGCKRGNDLYVSPNDPSTVTPALLLTAIEVSTFNTYESDLVKRGSVYVQQNVGIEGQSLQVNKYIINEQDFDNTWTQLYQTLYSCQDMQNRYGAANPYYSGITNILAAMNWGILTDMWGDIPFSQALQGKANNYQAPYDQQQQVITGILALLDSGIQKLSMSAGDNDALPGKDDLAFNGDAASWIRVAWTLKARYLNRLSNKSSYDPAQILTCIGNGITSSAQDFVSVHGPNNAANQWVDFQNNRAGYILAGGPFVDSISLRPTDIRLYYYFDSTGLGGVIGSPVAVPDADASPWGAYLAGSSSTGVHLVSYVEAKFIEAEVKTRQNAGDAATVLNDAIKESCTMVTGGAYNGADIATYTTGNINIGRVMYEKWIALFGSAEPYNDYRRTGYPALTPNPSGVLTVIPKRNPTPLSERTGNPNAPTPALTDAVWFAVP